MSACCGQTNFTPFGILFDWMEPKPPKRRKFESPRKKIKNDNPREIQQMSRRNDSGFESLAETYGKRGQLYWKVSAEARLSAEGSWCHRPATISHFPTQGPTLPPSHNPHPANLSIHDASICPFKRSILDLDPRFVRVSWFIVRLEIARRKSD